MFRKLFTDWCKSYYKFIYWLLCLHLFIHVLSIDQLKLMIDDTLRIIKSNFKHITYIYDQNTYPNNTNIKSRTTMTSTSINCIVMLITEVICTFDLFYTVMNHLSIETLMYLFTASIMQFDYFIDIYTFHIHDLYFQSTFTSIITIIM